MKIASVAKKLQISLMGLRGKMPLCDNFKDIIERLGSHSEMRRTAYRKISNLIVKSKNRITVIPKMLRSQLIDALAGAEAKAQEHNNSIEVPGGEDPGEYSGYQKSKEPGIPTLLCTSNWQRDLKSSCVGHRSPLQSPLQREDADQPEESQSRISDATTAETRRLSSTQSCVLRPSMKNAGTSTESTRAHRRRESTKRLRTGAKNRTTQWLLDQNGSTEASYGTAEKTRDIRRWMESAGASAGSDKVEPEEPTAPLRIDTNCETTRWLHEGSTSSSHPCLFRKRPYQLAPDLEHRTRKKPSDRVKSKRRGYASLGRSDLPRSHSWHRPIGPTNPSRSTKLQKEDEQSPVDSWLATLDFVTLCKVKQILQNNNAENEEDEESVVTKILSLLKDPHPSLVPPPITPGKGKIDHHYSFTPKRRVLHRVSSMSGSRSPQKLEHRDKRKPHKYAHCKSEKLNSCLSQKKHKRCDLCMRRGACIKNTRIVGVERANRVDSLTTARRWYRKAMRRKYQRLRTSGAENTSLGRFGQSSQRKRKKSMTELDDDGSTPPPKWQHLHVAAFLNESELLEVLQNRRRRSLHWFQRLAKYPRKYYTTILIPSRDIRTWRRWLRANGDPSNEWENTASCTVASRDNCSVENIRMHKSDTLETKWVNSYRGSAHYRTHYSHSAILANQR